jgi:hypothetical protein
MGASHAVIVRAWASNHRDHQVADANPRDRCPYFDNFAQRFVADHQAVAADGRRSVLECADFPVRAAYARFDHAKLHVRGAHDLRFRKIDDCNPLAGGRNGDSLHDDLLFVSTRFAEPARMRSRHAD